MGNLSKAAAELYRQPRAEPCPWKVGDWMEKPDGTMWEILSINSIMRPFKEANQTTYTVGYTYGLRRVKSDYRPTGPPWWMRP